MRTGANVRGPRRTLLARSAASSVARIALLFELPASLSANDHRTPTTTGFPPTLLGRRGRANGVDDEVGASLEEEVEQPTPAEETRRPPEQGDEPRLVEAGCARRLHGLADTDGDRAPGPNCQTG